jgi:hypothetical protein
MDSKNQAAVTIYISYKEDIEPQLVRKTKMVTLY